MIHPHHQVLAKGLLEDPTPLETFLHRRRLMPPRSPHSVASLTQTPMHLGDLSLEEPRHLAAPWERPKTPSANFPHKRWNIHSVNPLRQHPNPSLPSAPCHLLTPMHRVDLEAVVLAVDTKTTSAKALCMRHPTPPNLHEQTTPLKNAPRQSVCSTT